MGTQYSQSNIQLEPELSYIDDFYNRNLIKSNTDLTSEPSVVTESLSSLCNPLTTRQVYSYLGFLLGTFPPMTLFFQVFLKPHYKTPEIGILLLLLFVNLVCSIVGYQSGKLIGKIIEELENFSWGKMLLGLPFIGLFWGIITGAAGGFFVFILGAFFGAIFGGFVGLIALPVFTVLHRLLKTEHYLERNLFLPIAFGITFSIVALFLSF